MSEIAQLLRDKSGEINEQLEKVASEEQFLEQTKLAAVASLVEQGVDSAQAEDLVKSAEELQGLAPATPEFDMETVSSILVKAASYIEQLESEIAETRAKIVSNDEVEKQAAHLDGHSADLLQGIGFSQEQVKMLGETGLLEKVAQVAGKPWDMGEQSGRPDVKELDPIAAFCFGSDR